jgi:hypothetical protein
MEIIINDRLKTLFNSNFADGEWHENDNEDITFKCQFKDNVCKIANENPSCSCALGTPNTKIMIVAEKPSGKGKHICGNFERMAQNFPNMIKLIGFIQELNNTEEIPYFTDLIKCGGINSQIRINKCTKLFLVEEIKILKPSKIYCIGKTSYNWFDKNSKIIFELYQGANLPEITYLIHYSAQANMNLTIEDKLKIYWQIQAQKLTEVEFTNKILQLSEIKDLWENNQKIKNLPN